MKLKNVTMYSINVVCTSIGRDTLPRLIESFINQLSESDIFTIISDINHQYVADVLSKYDFKFKVDHIINNGGMKGAYGHPLLNQHINNLEGDFIMFADDDDRYTEGAFDVIKQTLKDKNKLYVFRHKWGNTYAWNLKNFDRGNVGKCMCAIPNTHNLPNFEESVLGDAIFFEEISKIFDYEFIDHVIYKVRDTE